MTKVTLHRNPATDRDVALFFWTSTEKDEDAYECPEEEIIRILRFGMKAQPTVHATPWGHDSIIFKVEDISLAMAMQWLRHRVQNFSMKSYRYVQAKGMFYLPKPEHMRVQTGRRGHYTFEEMNLQDALECIEIMQGVYDTAYDGYQKLLAKGLCMEQARFVLPTALLSKFYASGSLRDWMNFLVARNDPHAQWEIQDPARQIEDILSKEYPITMAIWKEYGRRIV